VLTSWVENAATGIELLAAAIIFGVIVVATLFYLSQIIGRRADANTYTEYRHQVARAASARFRNLGGGGCHPHGRVAADTEQRAHSRSAGGDPDFSGLVIGDRDRGALALAGTAPGRGRDKDFNGRAAGLSVWVSGFGFQVLPQFVTRI
jgi:type II secretory pathway pseudopilin PulG